MAEFIKSQTELSWIEKRPIFDNIERFLSEFI